MSDIIALFDMDNTLFDYEGKLKTDLKSLMSAGEEEPEDIWDETKPWLKARIDLITSVPGWWRTLPKFQLGWDLYDLCDHLGFECHVLTKGPRQKSFAWSEKVDCIQQHFGDAVNIDIVGKDKRGSYGRVLVDDYGPYILGWLEHRPRGLAIMPAHTYNEGFEHPNVIRYTGGNLEEIQRLLVAVKQRRPGEHWDRYL